MSDVRFPYRPKTAVFLAGTLFFAGCALGLGYVALHNDKGLILNGVLEFSVEGATIFYWCLVAASCLFVVFGSMALVSGLRTEKEVVLTDDGINSPKSGLSKTIVTVKFSDIGAVNIQTVQNQRFLNIIHHGGTLTIPQNMLSDKHAFEELASLVAGRVDI